MNQDNINYTGAHRLTLDDGEFHVFDLDSDQQKVYLADNHVLEVISTTRREHRWLFFHIESMQKRGPRLVVFEFNVETLFNAHLHSNGIVDLRRGTVRIDPNVLFLHHIGHSFHHFYPHKVPAPPCQSL